MKPLEGIRVVELASWVMVPAAGAVLADWGAEVIKVEHPIVGDPMRGMVMDDDPGAPASPFELVNRGKRSIGVDVATPSGRDLLYEIIKDSDVFLTSFLPHVRQKLGVDVGDLRAANPGIIYAKGSAMGPLGPESGAGGFDYATYWSRGGVASAIFGLNPALGYPPRQLPALGDLFGATMLAGGVSAALVRRALQGAASIVDISLLASAIWQLAPDCLAVLSDDAQPPDGTTSRPRDIGLDPLVDYYETKDARHLLLYVVDPERDFTDLGCRIGRPDLPDDKRFSSQALRLANGAALSLELKAAFASRTLAEWREVIAGAPWVCEPVQFATEVAADPQVAANEYIIRIQRDDRGPVAVAASPVQFDERSPILSRAPRHGGDTDAVLEQLGHDWDAIIEMKIRGVVV